MKTIEWLCDGLRKLNPLVRHMRLSIWMTFGSFLMVIFGVISEDTFFACAYFSNLTLLGHYFIESND